MSGDERRRRLAETTALPRQAPPTSIPERVRALRPTAGAHQVAPGDLRPPVRAGVTPTGAGVAPGATAETPQPRGLAAVSAIALPAVLDRAAADRQLAIGAIVVVLLARLVDGPIAWLVAALLAVGVFAGAGFSRTTANPSTDAGESAPTFRGRWESVVNGSAGIESGIVPAALAFSLALAVRLVPLDWWLIVALVPAFLLLERTIGMERSVALSADHAADRWKVAFVVLATAFLGFAGIASMIGGGLGGPGAPTLPESDLALLAGGDAVLATLLGFRLARLGPAARREGLVSGLGFGAVVAIGAGLLRAMAIPQLVGPALLTLLVYLWDALNATTPSIRRDPRWRWQVGLLLVLSAVVIGWNLRLRQ